MDQQMMDAWALLASGHNSEVGAAGALVATWMSQYLLHDLVVTFPTVLIMLIHVTLKLGCNFVGMLAMQYPFDSNHFFKHLIIHCRPL